MHLQGGDAAQRLWGQRGMLVGLVTASVGERGGGNKVRPTHSWRLLLGAQRGPETHPWSRGGLWSMMGGWAILTPPFRDLQEPWCWYWDTQLLLSHGRLATGPCDRDGDAESSLWHIHLLN